MNPNYPESTKNLIGLKNEAFVRDFDFSTDIVEWSKQMKYLRIKWLNHVACMIWLITLVQQFWQNTGERKDIRWRKDDVQGLTEEEKTDHIRIHKKLSSNGNIYLLVAHRKIMPKK